MTESKSLITLISRVDGLWLAASQDAQLVQNDARDIIKRISQQTIKQKAMTIEAGSRVYYILTQSGVIYMTACERGFPSNLCWAYLSDVAREFEVQYGSQVAKAERPYAFIKFEVFIQKTRKTYTDNKYSSQNMDKLKTELHDVQEIFRSNLNDLMNRGEKLTDLSTGATELAGASSAFRGKAAKLQRTRLLYTYGPIALIVLIILVVIIWKIRG